MGTFIIKSNQQAVQGIPTGKLNDLDKRLKAVESTEASDMQKSVYDPAGGAKQVAFASDLSSYLKLDQTTPQTTVGRFSFPNIAVDTNTIYTDSVNHRVGIGTTNPAKKLTIVDTIDGSLYIRKNTTTTGDYSEILGAVSTADIYNTAIRTYRDGRLGFFTNNVVGAAYSDLAEGLTISKNGNIGIGLNNPTSKLHIIAPDTTVSPVLTIKASNYPAYGIDFDLEQINNGYLASYSNRNGTRTLGISLPYGSGKEGWMGLGIALPTYKLDVRGTGMTGGVRSAMGFDIYQVPDPIAPTGVVSAGGSVDTGAHYYAVTYITSTGETHSVFSASQITTTAGNNTVTLTIPVSTDPRVTGRKIYRCKAGEATYQDYYLATVSNNVDTTYVDTVADSSLTGVSGVSYFRLNTTSQNISINGNKSLTLDDKGTSLGLFSGASLTTGGRNVFIGAYAGYGQTGGTDGVSIGHYAGGGAVNSSRNVFIGSYTGRISTGANNTAVGSYSLFNNTTGYYNATLGDSTLQQNISGYYNTAIAVNALYSNTTGFSNVAIGYNSMYGNISGSSNTAVGVGAGRYIADGTTGRTTGTLGLYLGYNSKASADGTDNEIVIGSNAVGKGSNTAIIGNSSLTALYVSGQVVPAKLSTAPTAIEGGIYYNTTDKHFYGYNGTSWKQLDN